MKTNHAADAEKYYKLIGQKNIEEAKKYLHPEVEFTGPLATMKGKEATVEATKNFMNAFSSLRVRAVFGSENQGMVVYNVDFPGIANDFPGASLLNFEEGLIVKIELFYDGSRLLEKKEEIFSELMQQKRL